MKVLVLDNYDSFTYNLVHFLEKSDSSVSVNVFRNDQISLAEINDYQKIVLSPGPGLPSEAGIMLDLIKSYSSTKSILGICLGHQAIAEAFGGTLKNLKEVVHGVSTPIKQITSDYIFENMPDTLNVGRYHSWVVDFLPTTLTPIALDMDQQIMAIRHNQLDVRGIQFHPESILTESGQQLINNWINHSL
jgi:anthranilate synthase component 2